MGFSNYWKKVEEEGQMKQHSFSHVLHNCFETAIDETWRKLVPLATELRNSPLSEFYERKSVDAATIAASRFVSMMPDNLLVHKQLVDFDMELDESVEMVFQGRQQVRVNLMLDSMNTHEEAFVFYRRDGNPTQTNGYMAEVVEILKQVL